MTTEIKLFSPDPYGRTTITLRGSQENPDVWDAGAQRQDKSHLGIPPHIFGGTVTDYGEVTIITRWAEKLNKRQPHIALRQLPIKIIKYQKAPISVVRMHLPNVFAVTQIPTP